MKRNLKIIFSALIALVLITAALVVGVFASNKTPTLVINGANVSFEGTVHLLYSVGYENVNNPNDIKLLVWREADVTHVDNCLKGTENVMLDSTKNVNENGVVGKGFDFDDLAAAEMTENIYVRGYVEIDGEAVYSPVVKYSILQYSLNKLGITGTASSNADLKEMLRQMLEYGAAAQTYFFPNSDKPLPTESFVKVTATGATFADGTASVLVKLGEKFTLTATPTTELPYVIWTDSEGKQVGSGTTYTAKATSNMKYTATLSAEGTSFGAYEHVVIVGIDGAGGSLFESANMSNANAIFANGAVTYEMLTNPSVSAHSWTSFFHGVETEDHGILSNEQVETTPFPTDSKYPSFLRVIREANEDAKLASIATWGGINVGIVEDGLDIYKYKNGDANGTAEAVKYINENNDLEVLYVHLNDPDAAGHGYGYGGTEYNSKMKNTDNSIGAIYQALADNNMLEDTLFIVTTDHGGADRGHGGLTDAETRVFFGAVGKTVTKGVEKIEDMEIRDCASIVLYALGYAQPDTYTGRVPAGLFDGVKATERPVYYDADNSRDILESGDTPLEGSDGYITNFINKPLYVYMPFDGNVNDELGNTTTALGSIDFVDGYYGGAVSLDAGSVELSTINPNVKSFTISMYVKTPLAFRKSPLLTNISWNEANVTNAGYVLAFDGDATPNSAIFNVGDGTNSYSLVTDLPADYNRGWMHVTLIVDRTENELGICFDFGEIHTLPLPDSFKSKTITSSQHDLAIGDNTQSSAPHKMSLTVDEFMIFDGAFDEGDINGLAEYFGKTPTHDNTGDSTSSREHENVETPTVGSGNHLSDYNADLFGKLDYYLTFDKTADNSANSGLTTEVVGNLTYSENGYFGEALRLRGTTSYIKLPEASYGKNSFSIAFWVNTGELHASTIPIISSQVLSPTGQGFTLFMNNSGQSVNFYLSNGSTRYSNSVSFPSDYKDGWTYVVFVMDRENKEWKISYDFGDFASGSIASNDYSADGAADCVWTIGQDGKGSYWTPLMVNIDEFMIFNGTLSRRDISTLAKYYGKSVPGEITLEDYLNKNDPSFDKDIMLELDFNGDVYNTGSQNSSISTGEMVYQDSPFGTAADFSGKAYDKDYPDNYVISEEFKLCEEQSDGGYNSISFSFWLKLNESAIGSNDRIIFSTTDVGNSDYVSGIAAVLYGAPIKIKETALPAYANKDDYVFDEEGYAMYKSTGEYVYRQLLQIRATSETADPASATGAYYYQRQGLYIYASMSEWSHMVIVYDRGEYSVNDGEYRVYQNGVKLAGTDKWNDLKMSQDIQDQASFNGAGLMINDDVNHYPRALHAMLDEFVIFSGALTDEDVALIAAYYESIRDTDS